MVLVKMIFKAKLFVKFNNNFKSYLMFYLYCINSKRLPTPSKMKSGGRAKTPQPSSFRISLINQHTNVDCLKLANIVLELFQVWNI